MRTVSLCLIFLLFAAAGCQVIATELPAAALTPTVSPLLKEKTSTVEAVDTPAQKPAVTVTPAVSPTIQNAFAINTRLGRGINLGNALEAPNEGDWGVTLQAEYFRLIKEQGFLSVRVPIRWSAHAALEAPYTIDPAFFERIDWVVDQALENDLAVIINMHHYYEIMENPGGQRERFLALWEQIAARYQDTPDSVLFELLNEPNGSAMTAPVWNELAAAGLAKIRETNPRRYVVIGPARGNSVDALDTLQLPENDERIIATFHYYHPFEFTHQGAEWAAGSGQWLGTKWQATNAQKEAVSRGLDTALRWSKENRRPVLLGEFGAYHWADMDSRALWTAYLAREAEARGFSWTYWEFCAGFGIYDPKQGVFFPALVEALIPPS